MRRAMSRFAKDEQAKLDLTPMLDVVFIMLIFFIVTAVFIKEPGARVLKPEARTAELKPTVSILVAINAADEIWIDKDEVGPAAVRGVLERMIAENPKGSMVIQADEGAKNELLMQVLDAARAAGIQQVAVAAEK